MKNLLFIGLVSCLSACSWFEPHYLSGREGQRLPDITLMLKDSLTPLPTATLPKGKPFVLFLYRPDCPYCQAQMTDIIKNIKDFHSVHLILVTSYPYRSIKQFADYYKLNNYSNITLARDSASQLLTYFNAPGVPYLAFYDKQKNLKKVIPGKPPEYDLIKNSLSD